MIGQIASGSNILTVLKSIGDAPFSVNIFLPIMEGMVEASRKLQEILTHKTFVSLDLASILTKFCSTMTASRFLLHDVHAIKVLSWWLPQLLETIAALLLLSNSSEDGIEQTLGSESAFQAHLNVYTENTTVALYLLMGRYFLQQPSHGRLQQPIREEDRTLVEELTVSISGHIAAISAVVRETALSDWVEDMARDLDPPPPKKGPIMGFKIGDDDEDVSGPAETDYRPRNSWPAIRASLPPAMRRAIELFSLLIPHDLSFHLSTEPSLPEQSHEQPPPKVLHLCAPLHWTKQEQNVLERAVGLSLTLETLRSRWPVRFSLELESALHRNVRRQG